MAQKDLIFQSTCPARGTTNQYYRKAKSSDISIHVPREGHDHPLTRVVYPVAAFQSTCPARGTTWFPCRLSRCSSISIHVPREGHDLRPRMGE